MSRIPTHNLLGGLAKYLDHSKSLPNFDDSQLVPPKVNTNFVENLHQKSPKKILPHQEKHPAPPSLQVFPWLQLQDLMLKPWLSMGHHVPPWWFTWSERWNLLVDGNWKKGGDLGMCVFNDIHMIFTSW